MCSFILFTGIKLINTKIEIIYYLASNTSSMLLICIYKVINKEYLKTTCQERRKITSHMMIPQMIGVSSNDWWYDIAIQLNHIPETFS